MWGPASERGTIPSRLSDRLGKRLPISDRALDFLVVAASGEEQVGALPGMLERFPPLSVLWSGSTQGTYVARQLADALNDKGIPVVQAESGQAHDLGQGARLLLLHAGARGAVLLLE